ncbi:MAG TPA: hypothetical protein VHX44_07560, partial [Planctomycetota bacterium]|nr:hypothetical protein [Planctomycetota bacterium]
MRHAILGFTVPSLLAGMILEASATYLIAAEGTPAKTFTIMATASSFQLGNELGFAFDGSGASLWHSK